MCAVPTVVERIYKGIHSKINAKGPFMVQLLDFCVQYRTKWVQCGFDTPIMNKVIFSKFRSLLGGRMKMLLSGGAPLAEESQNFVRTVLCTTLHQGNGKKYLYLATYLTFGSEFYSPSCSHLTTVNSMAF